MQNFPAIFRKVVNPGDVKPGVGTGKVGNQYSAKVTPVSVAYIVPMHSCYLNAKPGTLFRKTTMFITFRFCKTKISPPTVPRARDGENSRSARNSNGEQQRGGEKIDGDFLALFRGGALSRGGRKFLSLRRGTFVYRGYL